MESSDELEHLAKVKKSSTATLKAKLVKFGYTVEEIDQVTDREILISECQFIAGFGQSSIRKMATPVLPTYLSQMMQMLMLEREDRRLEREAAEKKEERRLEREAKERETASENAKLEREAAKERVEREVEERRRANERYEQLMQGMIEMQRSNKESNERAADKQMADRAQQIEREGGTRGTSVEDFW